MSDPEQGDNPAPTPTMPGISSPSVEEKTAATAALAPTMVAEPTPVVPPAAAAVTAAEAKARAEAKKRLGRTAIGIAPPAMGSKGPEVKPNDPAPPPAIKPRTSEPPRPTGSVRPGAIASERPPVPSKPPPPVPTSNRPPPVPSKPPPVPSNRPPVPSKPPPPVAAAVAAAPPLGFDTLVTAAPIPPPPATIEGSAAPPGFNTLITVAGAEAGRAGPASRPPPSFDTLITASQAEADPVAAAPSPAVVATAAGADHPLAATTRSNTGSNPPPPQPAPAITATFGSAGSSGGASAKTSPSKLGGTTLIGTAPPVIAPIVPRRRTPGKGMPAAPPVGDAPHDQNQNETDAPSVVAAGGVPAGTFSPKVTPLAGTHIPKITPAAGMPPDVAAMGGMGVGDLLMKEKAEHANKIVGPPVGVGAVPPPIIRIPQGGLLGSSAPPKTDRSGSLICELLIKNGAVTQEAVDKAIAMQEERGGQIGRILVQLGACNEEAIARALIEQLRIRKDEGQPWSDISAAARQRKDVVGLKVLTRPTWTVITLLVTDIFSLLLAALVATSVHWFRTYSELQTIDWTAWLVVGPSIGLCMLTFLGLELYSPMAKGTPDEIRDIVFAASLVHLGASLLATLGDLPIVRWGIFVRTVWWMSTLFLVPVVRSIVRNYLSVQPWWGIPVCVLGAAKTGRLIVRTLKAQPRSGLKPVMLLDDDIAKYGTLRASFTNEKMDVYSVNVSAAHFLTESQRAELSSDIFGDEADRASQPISSDHIPIAPEAWTTKVDVVARSAAAEARGGMGGKIDVSNSPSIPGTVKSSAASAAKREEELLPVESVKSVTRSQITKDASQFPRGKFAEVDGVPLVGDLSLAPILATRLNIPYAVLAMPGVDSSKLLQIVERIGGKFTHLLIIPDLFGFATMGVPAKSLGGILGVEVRQQLLLPGPRLAKRLIDIALTGIGAFFVLPFLLLIAALIKLDSKGSLFYTQKRLGKDGGYFDAYKFRTMHGDGEERLKAILDADPALRAEYDIYHKLRKDPRVTRIGRILRKFSLDEFPQLLNVIKGDMSLVGPRPYIERELTEMGGQEKIILRAPPGMTGMWQVSDRNATSFAQRVQIDVYYVRNWSPWLDIHILAKTFGVVIKGSGV